MINYKQIEVILCLEIFVLDTVVWYCINVLFYQRIQVIFVLAWYCTGVILYWC